MTSKKTILVVEDDELQRGQLEWILRRDYEVITAKDGVEALGAYWRNAGKIELVLTDWEMPVLNGIQLIVRLWRHDPELPVILMTGGLERGDFRGLLETPNMAVLWKPFDSQALGELISCLTEKGRAIAAS